MAEKYKNTYFILRHGISEANEEGIIIADPANGVPGYGLSEKGIEETRAKLKPESIPFSFTEFEAVRVYSSDFRRARETAEIYCELNSSAPLLLNEKLRERNFGDLEKKSHERYGEIWKEDEQNPNHSLHNSESPNRVVARLEGFFMEVEEKHSGSAIIAVAHGDILQIMQTIFAGIPANKHRSLPHLGNAELRRLN